MKRTLSILIMCVMLVVNNIPIFASEAIRVSVNGTIVRFNQPPILEQGVLLAPFKPIADLTDTEIRWNETTRTTTIIYKNKGVALQIDNFNMTMKDGNTNKEEVIGLDVAPIMRNGEAYMPIRVIAKAFDWSVNWDNTSQTQIISTSIPTLKIGDEIGNVLNTDIKTFINGYRIPSYNINNKAAVLIKDLISYGFDSVYNDRTRSSSVTYNPNKKISPLTIFDETSGKVGTTAFRYVYTDIIAFVNSKKVESFNIKGNLAIFFGDLEDYGTFVWDNAKRESRFTLNKSPSQPPSSPDVPTTQTPVNVAVTRVTLDKTSTTIKIGETLTLSAVISPANATDKSVTWTSSNANVARVYNGYIVAIAPGTAIITVTTADGNKTATCAVTVNELPPIIVSVTGVVLNKTSMTLTAGNTETLTATISPNNATNKSVSWNSNNTSVATVNNNGVVTAISAGTETITVTTADGNRTATCTVTVNARTVAVTGITINRTSASITENESINLIATIAPSNATDKSVTWTSSNTGVVRVDNNGRISGVAPGTATITATSSNGLTARCTVTVTSAAIVETAISLDKTSATIKLNDSFYLIVTFTPSNTTNKTLIWTSSNSNVARVDSNGYVTGVANGTATITATSANGKTARCTITVSSVTQVTSISLNTTTISLTAGNSQVLTATVLPSNATDRSITWTSSNSNVASISNGGLVTAVSAGTATITATSSNGLTARCTVTVTSAHIPVTSITSVPTTAIARVPLSLTGTVNPNNATNKTITWSIINAGTTGATINGNTLNTSAAGTVTVQAFILGGVGVGTSHENYLQNFSIVVSASNVPVTSITGIPVNIAVGSPFSLSLATVNPFNATNKTVTWSIANKSTTIDATLTNNTLTVNYNASAYYWAWDGNEIRQFIYASEITIKAVVIDGLGQGRNYEREFTIWVSWEGAHTGMYGWY